MTAITGKVKDIPAEQSGGGPEALKREANCTSVERLLIIRSRQRRPIAWQSY